MLTVTLSLISLQTIAQTDSFDVFTYHAPQFYTKSELPSRVQFHYSNSDTSFCTITIYKSQVANPGTSQMSRQWNDYVIKKLMRADKKPQKILTGQELDGWTSTLAIGNFYQNKRKCVVMLNSFTKDKLTACVVFVLGDKGFKGSVENFSKQLHLNTDK